MLRLVDLTLPVPDRTFPLHRTLLGAGVVIVEGLDMRAARPGLHDLICLPLAVAGGDGSPARAVRAER